MMQHTADAFTTAAVLAGLWAALQWWKSGRVQIKDVPGIDPLSLEGMVDLRQKTAMHDAIKRTDDLNSSAALWTAASVALQAVATVLGRLAMPG